MAYALDLVIAALCCLVAIPLLMQLAPSTTYRRTLEAADAAAPGEALDAEACGAAATYEADGLREEVVNLRGADQPAPEGEGWQRDPAGKEFRHYLSFALGLAMLTGGLWLIFDPPWPSHYIAWALFAVALCYGARDIPRLFRLIGKEPLHPANFITCAIALIGLTESWRLF